MISSIGGITCITLAIDYGIVNIYNNPEEVTTYRYSIQPCMQFSESPYMCCQIFMIALTQILQGYSRGEAQGGISESGHNICKDR